MSKNVLEKTKQFLRKLFMENPHFSFGIWKIMYDHSILVHKFSLKIAEQINCDKVVLSIGALLHDIGKTYKTDEQTLREKHKELGYTVSKDFLETLALTQGQRLKLKKILSNHRKSIEKQIIEDADIIAFFADEQLQRALKDWADKKGLSNELKRKLDKFDELKFDISKEIAEPLRQRMKKRWKL